MFSLFSLLHISDVARFVLWKNHDETVIDNQPYLCKSSMYT